MVSKKKDEKKEWDHSTRRGFVKTLATGGAAVAVASSLLDWTAAEGLGLSKAISIGNKADVDESDLLEYLAEDPFTKVITAYLESIKNGNKFIRVSKRVTKQKPFILMKAGRTKGGASAAASHTGALAGSDEVIDAVLKQLGVIRVDNSEQMLDLANALAFQPPTKDGGDRILVVTNGGGAGVMSVDKLEQLVTGSNTFRRSTESIDATLSSLLCGSESSRSHWRHRCRKVSHCFGTWTSI